MEVSGHVCTWATLCQEESCCVHWLGSWISLRTDLDAVQKRKLYERAWNKTVVIQPLVYSLYTMSYHMSSNLIWSKFIFCVSDAGGTYWRISCTGT